MRRALFRPPNRIRVRPATFIPGAPSANVSVALTGVSGTGAVGTLVDSISYALTGNAATGSLGNVGDAISYALTGNQATGAVGTLGRAITYGLTGVAGSGAVGSVSSGTGGSAALTGVSGTGSVGTVVSSVSYALTGVAGTGSVGSVSRSQALTGVNATGAVGTPVSAISVALTGVLGSGSVGSVQDAGNIIKALSGVSATGSVGTVTLGTSFYTTAAYVYIPVRMLSGVWTQTGVTDDESNLKTWLPPARQPIAYQQNGQWLCDPTWYRFFQYVAEIKLGGVNAPSIPAVASATTAIAETAASAQTQVSAVIQQGQTNAEALAAARQVLQDNSLAGADQIPPVQLSPYEALP